MPNPQILIIDPYKSVYGGYLESIITEKTQFKTVSCTDIDEIKSLKNIDLVLIFVFLDKINQPDAVGFNHNLLAEFKTIPTVGIIESCINCKDWYPVKKELCNFIIQPFDDQDVLHHLYKYTMPRNESKAKSIQSFLKMQAKCELLHGKSDSICQIRSKLHQISPYNVNVLITGESGTGKELCARMIHFLSPRLEKPFIAVNCGAIPKELFENELFGHKKGAYTDANTNEIGLVASANGGTLFLDEVESLSDSAQVKLLRFLEEKKYKPLGQANYIESDIRIIAAAKENLYELSKKNIFREDLFYRLDVVEVSLPPLRERKEDIPDLVSYFTNRYSSLHDKTIIGIKDDALVELLQYDWPGNIRELENVIQEAVVTENNGWISPENLNLDKFNRPEPFVAESFKYAKQKAIENFEKSFLEKTLNIFNGNIKKAAHFAQKDRRAYYNLMKKYDINPAIYRP